MNSFASLIADLPQDPKSLVDYHSDPIALAWASRNLWLANPGGGRWHNLNHIVASEQDLAVAQHIRRYYRDRVMMTMIRQNNKITEFRRKLYGLVTDSVDLSANDQGLIHRLPYFYAEDLVTDSVVEQTFAARPTAPERIQDTFCLRATALRSVKGGDVTQFWLQAQNHQPDAAWLLTVSANNPFHRLITGLLRQPVRLEGWAHYKQMRGHYRGRGYMMLNDIEIVNG